MTSKTFKIIRPLLIALTTISGTWLVLLLGGCAYSVETRQPVPIYCVPQSIACAWAWTVKYRTEVRMAVQKIRPGVDHVQAEALIDGEWKPLVMKWTDKGPVAYPGHKHFDVEPYRYLSLREWVKDQIQYTDTGGN